MNHSFSKSTILLLFAISLVACGGKKEQDDKPVQADMTPQVKIQTVNAISVDQLETYTGTVESDVKNNISPNAPYRIKKIYADVGDYVRKGQVLVVLDNANLSQANTQIQAQQGVIENAKLQMENQKVEFGRMEALYKAGGISRSEYDAAKLMYDQTCIAYDNAKKQLDILKSQTGQLSENTQLIAPMSGIVSARNYDDGDMYTSLPILTIEQTNPVKLVINVSEKYYENVRVGMNVPVAFDAYQGQTFDGTVTTIRPLVDQSTHTFPVEITLNNDNEKIRPGMYAKATINLKNEMRVVVPDMAIVKQIGAGDRYVYVYKDDAVTYQKIELGQHVNRGDVNGYEVKSGLNDGDQVVIAGMSKLKNGAKVKVVK